MAARNRQLSRRAMMVGGLAFTSTLSACGFFAPAPQIHEQTGGQMRAKRPYRPADPQEFAAILNSYRAQNGLQPLAVDQRLNDIATTYAHHLAEAGEMTHTLAPYGGLEKRLADAGFTYSVAGENLGEGQTDDQDVFDGWHQSPSHDRGMRDPDATIFGIGSAYRPDDRYQAYWCMIYAKPRKTYWLRTPFGGL